jgi:DNA-directed RNA polymerase specialized sigma subunit
MEILYTKNLIFNTGNLVRTRSLTNCLILFLKYENSNLHPMIHLQATQLRESIYFKVFILREREKKVVQNFYYRSN